MNRLTAVTLLGIAPISVVACLDALTPLAVAAGPLVVVSDQVLVRAKPMGCAP